MKNAPVFNLREKQAGKYQVMPDITTNQTPVNETNNVVSIEEAKKISGRKIEQPMASHSGVEMNEYLSKERKNPVKDFGKGLVHGEPTGYSSNIINQGIKDKWIVPCKGKIVGEFGEKRKTHVHNGIDIAVPIGTQVKAIADGIVIRARKADGYGKYVVIEHELEGKIITSEYGHIKKWLVSEGQHVQQGQVIALSGNEGYSYGPHVHLTIRIGKYRGVAVNPWLFIGGY